MRNVLAGIVVVLIIALAACATRATKAFTVTVSPYSVEYTPGQIHDYLRVRGFRRVQFQDYDSGLLVYEKRDSETDEQRFRLKTYPQIEVIVRLEKKRRGFGDTNPRVIVWFNEDDRSSFSTFAQEEYDRLIDEVTERVGADRVDVWED